MTKVTQKGDAGYIHKRFHQLAEKYGVDVNKVAEIIDDWESTPKNEYDAIVEQLKKKEKIDD